MPPGLPDPESLPDWHDRDGAVQGPDGRVVRPPAPDRRPLRRRRPVQPQGRADRRSAGVAAGRRRLPDDPVAARLHRDLRQRHDAARHDGAAVRPGLGQPRHADGEPRPRDVVPPPVPRRRVAAVRPARPLDGIGSRPGRRGDLLDATDASPSASSKRAWPGWAGEGAPQGRPRRRRSVVVLATACADDDATAGHDVRRDHVRRPGDQRARPSAPASPGVDRRTTASGSTCGDDDRRGDHDDHRGRRRRATPRPSPSPRSARSTARSTWSWRAGDDAPFVVDQDGHDRPPSATTAPTTVLDVHDPDRRRQRTGAARPGVRRQRRPRLHQLHRRRRQHGHRGARRRRGRHLRHRGSTGCSRSTSRTPTTTAATSSSAPTASCTSGWATAAPAATRSGGPRTPASCSARSCASTRGRTATSRTRSRRTTRSSASPAPGPRSGRPGSATRGGSRSTGPPATCGSPTSARTRSRRSTSRRPPMVETPARACTSAGARSRATHRYNDDVSPDGGHRAVHDVPPRRRAARSAAGCVLAARRSPTWSAGTSTPTTAPARCGRSRCSATGRR